MPSNVSAVVSDPERLAALRASGLLNANAEPVFDRLTTLAHQILHAPLVMVTLVDSDRQLFKSFVGLMEPWATRRETPLSHSFCQHALVEREPLVIENAPEHPVLRTNPAIRDLGVVSYAGVPLVNAEGHALGAFCVIDSRPRQWSGEELAIISELARSALTEIDLRAAVRRVERDKTQSLSEERRRALAQLALGLRHEINNALGGLLLTTDLLKSHGLDPESSDRYITIIQAEAQRVAGVVRRLDDIDALQVRPYLQGEEMIDVSSAEPGH